MTRRNVKSPAAKKKRLAAIVGVSTLGLVLLVLARHGEAISSGAGRIEIREHQTVLTEAAAPTRQPPATATSHFPEEFPNERLAPERFDSQRIQLCQALGPASPHVVRGVDCADGCCPQGWKAAHPIDWQQYAQGQYVGNARTEHVPQYRLRVDDQLELVYRLTRNRTDKPYKLNIGDEIRVESFTDEKLNRTLIVQPDGTITLPGLGQVPAWGLTVAQVLKDVEKRYEKWYKPPAPALTITPIKVNTKLDDLRAAVDARAGEGGQRVRVRVTPEGTIQLPALASVLVQGMTLDEVKREIDERYMVQAKIDGIEVTPVLTQRAPRYVYVLGEVYTPGRFQLEGPTTLMQALALAGSWKVGANLKQVVVFRRGEDWRLMATMLDIRGALYAHKPCPADEIWLADSDIVVAPKQPILVVDEFIELVFTRGIY